MIDVLLATYNGDRYLEEQIDSILAQTNHDWRLLIRDDGSQDGTVSIIQRYVSSHPEKIRRIVDEEGNLGYAQNFMELMTHSTSEYVMFCDQDDVWLPNKIELSLDVMKHAEKSYPNKPVLVCTDLTVVDDKLNLISQSFYYCAKYSSATIKDVCTAMVEPCVMGCTMMINKQAKEVSMPMSKEAIAHDWWIPIRVALHGKIVYCSVPTILYRQHAHNCAGMRARNLRYYLAKAFGFGLIKQIRFYRRQGRMIRSAGCQLPTRLLVKRKIIMILVKMLQNL